MTEGRVVQLTAGTCRGWARVPTLPRYAVTVHLVLDNRIQGSAIADRRSGGSDDPTAPDDCWFEIDVPSDAAGRLPECRILVGESGTYLQDIVREGRIEAASPASTRAPTSFRDAFHRGLSASDVIALLYLDILRRPADDDGLRFHLDELKGGRGSLESFRRSLLASDEYLRLHLRAREAPGGTFAKTIAYSSSTRRLEMEQRAPAFQRFEGSIRRKLLEFLPGLVAIPDALEALLRLADKGLPEREIFLRALSKLSIRPSLIAPYACELGSVREAALGDGPVVDLTCASPLFAYGWNKLEKSSAALFRWMEQVAVLINPRPERRLERLEVSVDGWYGDMDRTITAVMSDTILACERREGEGGGALLIFTSPDPSPAWASASHVALVAAAAACPWHVDGTPDMRLLSCRVTAVRFLFTENTV